jgi:hypothetical protein
MKILIDMGHPAHVHFFKNTIWELEKRGHQVKVTARDKDVTLKLLEAYGIPYVVRPDGWRPMNLLLASRFISSNSFVAYLSRRQLDISMLIKVRADLFVVCLSDNGHEVKVRGYFLNDSFSGSFRFETFNTISILVIHDDPLMRCYIQMT